jgi:hypothetical protein
MPLLHRISEVKDWRVRECQQQTLFLLFADLFFFFGLQAEFLDSREIIHVTDSDIGPAVDWGITLNKIGAWNADVAHHTSTFVVRLSPWWWQDQPPLTSPLILDISLLLDCSWIYLYDSRGTACDIGTQR